jgi:transposase-like protein
MASAQRRRWTAEEKLQVLEEARQAGGHVSEVCRRHQLAPGQFYLWERQARQGALQALRDGKRGRKPTDPTVRLQAEIDRLRVTVAELSTENLQLKKGLWP